MAAIAAFLDQYVFAHDRAAMLDDRIPAADASRPPPASARKSG
jgi:hypothetical protein